MKKLSKLVSLMLSLVLCIGMAAPAFAIEYDIETGRVHVENSDDGNVVSWQENHETYYSKDTASADEEIVITGTYTDTDENATGSRITVGENVTDTTITLKDVNIDVSKTGVSTVSTSRHGEAALSVTGKQSNVTIKLEGENTLKSGAFRAGLEMSDGASVTVDGEGSLTVSGGEYAAGIGTRIRGTAGDITISGSGTVNAASDYLGAGIGAGNVGKVGDITISGSGTVNAASGFGGAGIGGGCDGTAGNIMISGSGTVNATGGSWGGAGIGSGRQVSSVGNITISGSGTVTATGGNDGAGIGSGTGYHGGSAGNITISGSGAVTATGGSSGAGIGSGYKGKAGDITICGTAKVTATHGKYANNDIGAGEDGTVGTIINSEGKGHDYHRVETKPASCTEAGMATYTCKNCGDSYTEPINKLPHTEEIDKAVAPTCTETGLTEGKHCSVCDAVIVKQEEVPAKGHTEVIDDAKAPTCTETGLTEGKHCSVCDAVIVKQEEIPANGHTVVIDEAEPATTTSTGLTEGSHCGVCGEVLVAQEEIPMQTPTTPVFPVVPDDGTGADVTPDEDTTTLEDQEVPLAGLMPVAQLLEELRQYEEIEDVELPEDFKWINHEYAQAIYWALQEGLAVDTEEEPFDPDEVVTVALLREELTNFVELYKGLEDFVFTLEGEDDEIVMDLGERLAVFYSELEAYLKAQESKAA